MGRRSKLLDQPFRLNLAFGGPDKQSEMSAFHDVFCVLFGQRKPSAGAQGKDEMRAARAIARMVERDKRDMAKRARSFTVVQQTTSTTQQATKVRKR